MLGNHKMDKEDLERTLKRMNEALCDHAWEPFHDEGLDPTASVFKCRKCGAFLIRPPEL